MPRTVVLIPTFNHVVTLRPAIASAVAQTDSDTEIHVIGDGAPPETERLMDEMTDRYTNVRFHKFEKSPRTGEPYRDQLLRRIDAEFVLYLSDDDIWSPDHVEQLTGALADHDLAATLSAYCQPEADKLSISRMQFSDPTDRDIEMHESRVSLTETGHRLDSYLRLPHGWRTTPRGEYTDHWMWKQWLAEPWVRATTVETITTIHFADFMRKEVPIEDRVHEQEKWMARVSDPNWNQIRNQLMAEALFEGFAHADRGLVHFRRHAARIEGELEQERQLREMDTARLRAEVSEQANRFTSRIAEAEHEASRLRARSTALESELTAATETLDRVVRSRTWRYGQRLAKLSGYRSARSFKR